MKSMMSTATIVCCVALMYGPLWLTMVKSVPVVEGVTTSEQESTTSEEVLDYAAESEAMKMPIVGHILKFISTMYADIPNYKWVDKSFGKQPDFCRHYECPKYKVVCKNIFYEVRKYEPAKYVYTSANWDPKEDGDMSEKAFKRLYGYISGANDKAVKIKMTTPVFVHVKKSNVSGDKGCPDKSMKFYIPSEFQKDTPIPIDPLVKIKEAPALTVYVKMFGGYVLPSLWKPMGEKFHKVLEELKEKVDPDFSWVGATYDKPSLLINRHNEIIFKVGEEKADDQYCSIS